MEAVRPVVDKEVMTGAITGVEDPAEASNTSTENQAQRSTNARKAASEVVVGFMSELGTATV